MIKMFLVWIFAIFFLSSGIVLFFKSKWNMGSLAIWILAAGFTGYGLFMPAIDTFTQSGFGLLCKIAIILCGIFGVALIVFLAISGHRHAAQGNEVALIVLGAGLNKQTVSDILERRLQAGLKAYQKNPKAYLVVSGGQGHDEDIPEALAMQHWLLAHKVPANAIIVEDKSTSTRQNLTFSRALLQEKGISPREPIAVVTNTFHCFRARCYAKQAGFSQVNSIAASMNRPTYLQNYLREAMAVVQLWLSGYTQKKWPS